MDAIVANRFALQARLLNLDISEGMVRRTSSRFCFGVEHGDYNNLELFGVGTDRFIWIAYKPNTSGRIRIYSENMPEEGVVDFSLADATMANPLASGWARFPKGAVSVLKREGYQIQIGMDAIVFGNIPGGGMSRSASLSLNLIESILELNGYREVPGMDIVNLAQMVEVDYIGSPCGKLDQVMIYFAKAGMGTYFNPVNEHIEHFEFGGDIDRYRVVCMDTGTKRAGLEVSTYKVRRQQCDAMNAYLRAQLGRSLPELFQDERHYREAEQMLLSEMPDCVPLLRYLYAAQSRIHSTIAAWKQGDFAQVGANFRADGLGLRDEYQISGPELETMCDLARTVPGVLGERMLGGGDKGASGALVEQDAVEPLKQTIDRAYPRAYPQLQHEIHVCSLVDGVCVRPLADILS